MVTKFPFKEKNISTNIVERTFSIKTENKELQWHFDEEDRIITVLENKGWLLQMDNQLPKLLEGTIIIPKHTYHRVIKGSSDLKIKIEKIIL